MHLLVALFAYAGCEGSDGAGSDFVAEDFTQSGSRLKVYSFRNGDERIAKLDYTAFAVEVQQTRSVFFDADLGVDCVVMRWSDGGMYCTPGPYSVSTYYEPVYLDAECTQPAIILMQTFGACAGPPFYARLEEFETVRAFATLGSRTANVQYYKVENYTAGPECTGPLPLRSDAQLYEATHVFNPTELVPISLGPPQGDTGRLRWQYIESSDGFVAPGVIYDEKLGRTCGFGPSKSDDPTKLACRYRRNPEDPVVDDRVAVVTTRPSSEARLSPAIVESSQTRLSLAGFFYDRAIELQTRPSLTADGQYRAAGLAAGLDTLFEDAMCTKPIELAVVDPDVPIEHIVRGGSCSGITHVHDVGPKAPRPYMYSQTSMTPSCISYPSTAPIEFRRPGAEVPFDALGPVIPVETY